MRTRIDKLKENENSAKMQLQEVVLDAYKLSLDPNYVPKQSHGLPNRRSRNTPTHSSVKWHPMLQCT